MSKKLIFIALTAIFATGVAHAGAHKMGSSQACFYDSNPGHNKWHYYYCGAQSRGCAGKKGNGKNDKHYTIYHGQSFTFQTSPKDTYWCCGGTSSGMGTLVFGTDFYVETKTELKHLENGTCNRLIRKTVCGDTETTDCDTVDDCNPGYTLRNGACVAPCGEDEVYESSTSNTCIKCETTRYQGIVRGSTEASCLKCDKDTEFFDKTNKTCVKKADLEQYSRPEMKECWRCPNDYIKTCQQAIKEADRQDLSGRARVDAINSFGNRASITNLAKQCYLDE